MKVKIFQSTWSDGLEKEINIWLKKNVVTIHSMSCTSVMSQTNDTYLFVLIHYSELTT